MRDVVVIGSGISGLFSAYWCIKNAYNVKVVSKRQRDEAQALDILNLFYGLHQNAFNDLVKFARKESSFGFKNFADKTFLSWLLKFAPNYAKVNKKLDILTRRYAQKSYKIYEDLQSEIGLFNFEKSGSALLFFDDKSYKAMLERIRFNDENFEVLDAYGKNGFGFVNQGIKGAVNLKQNAKLDTQRLYENLREFLERNGVSFIQDEIVDYEIKSGEVSAAIGRLGRYEGDSFIQASGDDKFLAKKLGVNLELMNAKIYEVSFELDSRSMPKTALFLENLSMRIYEKNGRVNISMKPQINADDERVDMSEINENLAALKPFCSHFELKNPKFEAKNLAFTTNFMPVFGRDESYKNLLYISGFGLNETLLAPAISQILTDMIVQGVSNESSDDVLLFSGLYS
ncbi:NAD(P)/FAD-dependent oxidoreductase [Campylobacter sp.]|uniref:NAD(P)/FAD-dependent oxidoreductase n=1 Tax=Campylobacter sp. TaxID=205 RepID=UPI0027102DE1|nr:FAD-binding oxidoreductase [Campylobacter sp.]